MTPKQYREFLAIADEVSPTLCQHIKEVGPISIPNRKHQGLAQFLARVIIGQQLSTKAARTIWSRLEQAARADGSGVPGFFVLKNFDALRACGASGNKAKALIAINDAHKNGELAARRVKRLDRDQRDELLMGLRGIGQWTVDMAGMFYFADSDVWPAGDLAVARTFNRYLSKRQLARSESYVARFAPHRSYLAYYMWQIVDAVPN